jgi:hypothetical protein
MILNENRGISSVILVSFDAVMKFFVAYDEDIGG